MTPEAAVNAALNMAVYVALFAFAMQYVDVEHGLLASGMMMAVTGAVLVWKMNYCPSCCGRSCAVHQEPGKKGLSLP